MGPVSVTRDGKVYFRSNITMPAELSELIQKALRDFRLGSNATERFAVSQYCPVPRQAIPPTNMMLA
jgi:hypothetical protein